VVNARISGTSPDSHRDVIGLLSLGKSSCQSYKEYCITGIIVQNDNLLNQTMQTI
jgi:hypothetical protein